MTGTQITVFNPQKYLDSFSSDESNPLSIAKKRKIIAKFIKSKDLALKSETIMRVDSAAIRLREFSANCENDADTANSISIAFGTISIASIASTTTLYTAASIAPILIASGVGITLAGGALAMMTLLRKRKYRKQSYKAIACADEFNTFSNELRRFV